MALNISKHHKMTNEMYTEVLEVFKTLSHDNNHQFFNAEKLILALKALAMEPPTAETIKRAGESEVIDFKEFLRIISDQYLDSSDWCRSCIDDAFAIFDKNGNGYLDASELSELSSVNNTLLFRSYYMLCFC